ncbi:MAG: Na+/H+ antiporter subunit G [candidate division WOR-3 bacterium]|nr:MAG: Na+/H+ antiporter subunit G [candidate division WOR-3 bacterium]
MTEPLGWVFIIAGVIFNVLGCLGLVRFPDLYNRMQAATKSVTLGTCGILFGIFLQTGFSALGIKALVAVLFVVINLPVASHALSRGSLINGVKLWKKTIKDEFTEDRGGASIIDTEDPE